MGYLDFLKVLSNNSPGLLVSLHGLDLARDFVTQILSSRFAEGDKRSTCGKSMGYCDTTRSVVRIV